MYNGLSPLEKNEAVICNSTEQLGKDIKQHVLLRGYLFSSKRQVKCFVNIVNFNTNLPLDFRTFIIRNPRKI